MTEQPNQSEDRLRIRQSWAKAASAGDIVGRIFYANLFQLDPATKPLFPDEIDDQAQKLMQTLNWIVDHLDDAEQLVPAAQALAVRHVRYGVEPAHYDSVGKALLATLEQGLGSEFSEADRLAWTRVYQQLVDVMVSKAYSSA